MNRNTQSHFAQLPTVNIGRSKFDRGFTHTTTFNTGELVPVYVDPDIIPGDTVTMRQSEIVRMMTPICPVMDNAYMDFYWFFVPNRLVMNEWKKLMGENETAPWTQTVEVLIPQIKLENTAKNTGHLINTVIKGSVLDHMGIPTTEWWKQKDTDGEPLRYQEISSLPTKAYCLIWNEFFRDENLQNPVNISKGSQNAYTYNSYTNGYQSNPDSFTVTYAQYGGLPCLKVCKPHDYFTSALPGAQKGPSVSIPLYTDEVPVRLGKKWNNDDDVWEDFYTSGDDPIKLTGQPYIDHASTGNVLIGDFDDPTSFEGLSGKNAYAYLYSDMSAATGATVTALRQAFAIQKFYERDARGGWAKAI